MRRAASERSLHYRAPLRIDLAGGTLDIWPVYLQLADPVTINVAITRYAEVVARAGTAPAPGSLARMLHDAIPPPRPLLIETNVACPRGSGLGGSSALAVAITRALLDARGERPSIERVFRVARDVESRHIRTPTGDQDYLAALHGGCSVIRFAPGQTAVERLSAIEAELGKRLVLFYTGVPHFSGINNWAVFRAVFDGNRAVKRRLQSIASVSADLAQTLASGDLDRSGVLVGKEWSYRRGLAKGITTPEIERAFALCRRHGAIAGKVCGAGGGGAAFLFSRAGEAKALARRLTDAGYLVLPASVAKRGLTRVPASRRWPDGV